MPDLNPSQLQAVTHGEGPLLVLAGPGSGKTTVIVERIRHLIFEAHVPPEQIVVLTFTKDAAISMQQRFISGFDRSFPVNFGTFHSFFYHILLQSPHSYYSAADRPKILTASHKKSILLKILQDDRFRPDAGGYCGYDRLESDAVEILSAIGYYKNTGRIEEARKRFPADWAARFDDILEAYQRCIRAEKAMDFDDMVYECRRLLEADPACRKGWQERFSHILLDEFQDINPLQYQVIKLLTKPPCNLFAVGDDDQAIYGFRGSEPACLMRFAQEYAAEKITLEQNYRSLPAIVDAACKVIGENRERFPKRLHAAVIENAAAVEKATEPEPAGSPVRIRSFLERGEQMEYLAGQIRDFQRRYPGKSCAVLFRTNTFLQSFARLLGRAGIAYSMREKAPDPYGHFVARDVSAYLRFAAGDRRRAVFLQIMNKPSRYLRRDAVADLEIIEWERLKMWYRRYGGIHGAENVRAIEKLSAQIDALAKMPPALAIRYVCRAIGYEEYLRTQAGCKSADQLQEWLEILDWLRLDAADYESAQEWLAAQRQKEPKAKREPSGESGAQDAPGVQLMTVHASKGLEFDKVWIPDCNEKNFPHGNMPDDRTVEEERRVFYVGMTRAKESLELLYLTGSEERPRLMSRFLNPIASDFSSGGSIV